MKKCPHCKKPILSPTAERVLKFCKMRAEVEVTDVMRELGISISNANNYLRWLWETDFLDRSATNLKNTGGLYFTYRIKSPPSSIKGGGKMRIVIDKHDLQTLQDGFVASKIVKGVVMDIVLHKNTQPHIHHAGHKDIDKCEKCGLDIRDDIHIKMRPQEANMI